MKVVEQFKRRILDLAIRGKLVPPACRQAGKTRTTNPPLPEGWRSCWYTYVVECDDGSFYKGFTDDLMRRYEEHCRGIGAEHTKKHKPRQLYYWEQHSTREAAIAREKYLKSGVGREWFKRAVVDAADDWEPTSVLLERIKAEKEELACLPDRQVKAGKIKKEKKSSHIVIGLPAGQAGSDGAVYEKFGSGDLSHAEARRRGVDVPFDLPQGWAWARLEYLFRFIDYRGKTPHKIQDGIPLVTAKNVRQGYIDYSISEFISYDEFSQRQSRGVSHKGDILFTTEAPLGYVAIADLDVFSTGQRLITLQRYGDTDNLCIMHFMQSKFWQEYLYSKKTGTTVAGIKAEYLKEMLVPLPPLAEQKRIVAKIEELFAIADSLGAAADGLENAAKRLDKMILDLAIRGKLVPQNPNDEPASELVKRIAASHKSPCKNQSEPIDPPFEIPDSWDWVRLGDLFQHNTGKALNRNGQTGVMHRYITTSNVYWDEFKLDDLRQMPFTEEELEKCSVKKGDLLVCEGGDIGRAAIWNFNQSICIQNHLHRLRPFVKVCVSFFCFVLRLYKATNRLQGRGIGLQGFSSRMLHNLPVPLPPLAEQKRIVAKIEELRTVIKSLTT